jgi:hypothetical protein
VLGKGVARLDPQEERDGWLYRRLVTSSATTQRGAPQLPTGRLNLCVTQAAHPPGLTDTQLNSQCRAKVYNLRW